MTKNELHIGPRMGKEASSDESMLPLNTLASPQCDRTIIFSITACTSLKALDSSNIKKEMLTDVIDNYFAYIFPSPLES
jgi:hypothetical protein